MLLPPYPPSFFPQYSIVKFLVCNKFVRLVLADALLYLNHVSPLPTEPASLLNDLPSSIAINGDDAVPPVTPIPLVGVPNAAEP